MSAIGSAALTTYSPELADGLRSFAARVAARPDVQTAVEANHDNNRWWPAYVQDWRLRMAVAGWSARVSYAMIGTYAKVVAQADGLGWEMLTSLGDEALASLVGCIGLPAARIRYLRSLARFISRASSSGVDILGGPADDMIQALAAGVHGAGYNTAQCAVLYGRGYHCGVIPVDSGMITKLAPLLGITLGAGPTAYEQMRHLLQRCVIADAAWYQDLASRLGYQIAIPAGAPPTWFAHLVFIYFKRLYLNRPGSGACARRPACPELFGCACDHAEVMS